MLMPDGDQLLSFLLRFNTKKRIRAANVRACISGEIFEGLRKLNEPLDSEFSVTKISSTLNLLVCSTILDYMLTRVTISDLIEL